MASFESLAKRLDKLEAAIAPRTNGRPELVVCVRGCEFQLFWPQDEGYKVERLTPEDYRQWQAQSALKNV